MIRSIVVAAAVLSFFSIPNSSNIAQGQLEIKRPLLVNHGLSSRPWTFVGDQQRIAHIDGLPFSGFAYNIPATWTVMKASSVAGGPWTEADLHNQFGGLNFDFQNLTENWVSIVIRRNGDSPVAGDFFDDAAWQETLQQVSLLARVANTPEYQCVGFVFDNEEYFEDVWNYPDDVAFADQYTLEQYEQKARERGQQFMKAIRKEWRDAKVLVMHGPYRSTPEPRPREVSMDQIGNFDEYELDGPFFFGMAEFAPGKRVIDGGETYQLRTSEQFQINFDWRTNELGNSVIVPHKLGFFYSERVGVTHGLYNLSWPDPDADRMDPFIMRSTLRRALFSAKQNVWIFIENGETWLDPDGMPDSWRNQIEAGYQDTRE